MPDPQTTDVEPTALERRMGGFVVRPTAPAPATEPGLKEPEQLFRISVPLPETAYLRLRQTSLDWRLPATAILRAALAEMHADEALSRRVRVRAEDAERARKAAQ